MVNSAELVSDAYLVCLSHALTTEREEIMGLLLGEMKDNKVARICSAYPMRRSDKRPDRVEISPEQIAAAAIEAEELAKRLQRPIQVLGWYHSHPHITVWPSHVDVRTQASYQMMDPNFVGLIFSCFNDSEKKSSLQVICFQSVNRTLSDPPQFEHIEIPLRVVSSSTISDPCLSALAMLPRILFEEEQESYQSTQEQCEDFVTSILNGAVYTQALMSLLQVVCGPVTQLLEETAQRNRATIERLRRRKRELEKVALDRVPPLMELDSPLDSDESSTLI